MASAIDTQSARAVSANEHPPWRSGLAVLLGGLLLNTGIHVNDLSKEL